MVTCTCTFMKKLKQNNTLCRAQIKPLPEYIERMIREDNMKYDKVISLKLKPPLYTFNAVSVFLWISLMEYVSNYFH